MSEIYITKQRFTDEVNNAHMSGYAEGVLSGLNIAEKITGANLSEAKHVVQEEALKEKLIYVRPEERPSVSPEPGTNTGFEQGRTEAAADSSRSGTD